MMMHSTHTLSQASLLHTTFLLLRRCQHTVRDNTGLDSNFGHLQGGWLLKVASNRMNLVDYKIFVLHSRKNQSQSKQWSQENDQGWWRWRSAELKMQKFHQNKLQLNARSTFLLFLQSLFWTLHSHSDFVIQA